MGLLELRVVLCAVSVCQGIPTRQTMAAALVAVFLLSCQGGAQALCVSVFGPARPVSVASRQQQSCLSRKLPAIAGASSSPTSVSASDTSDSSSTERAAPAGFGSRAKRRKKGRISLCEITWGRHWLSTLDGLFLFAKLDHDPTSTYV